MLSYLLLMAFPLAMTLAAVWDIFTLTIPNRISLFLTGSFFVAALAAGIPAYEIGLHVACGLAILALGFGLFSMGSFGGGDAKLLAVAALWLGPLQLGQFAMSVALAGGVLAVAILLYRARPLPFFLLSYPWALRLHDRSTGIPYGVAITTGAMIVFPTATLCARLAIA